ncbi:MAG TPA: lamin tail domain-containing protein [Microbacterium sp.]|uniref:lamin tail domain-containing protein n=1 Tax=Microbacterium sp. TaxID=51671 RepID=UPI002BF41B37|nr:lamin tail domain-containing protein [Microbacterium sp.]HWI29982.1 lamin tail domain-containing protein [Microbacterium sp.]
MTHAGTYDGFRSTRRRASHGRLWVLAVGAAILAGLLLPVDAASAANRADIRADIPAVIINELAAASSISDADSFFELRNASPEPVDLTGWAVYRCDERGLRANLARPEIMLTDVVLDAGEIFTVVNMSARAAAAAADARFTKVFSSRGMGLVLVAPDGATVDSVAVYPNEPWPTESECGPTPNLPATLAAALDESWQRTADGRWVRAGATPGEPNAERQDGAAVMDVVIDEVAPAGPGGSADDFVELRNRGRGDVDLTGWRLFRCTALGAATADTVQVEFPAGTRLRSGERSLIAGPGFQAEDEQPGFRTRTSLADGLSGVLLVDDRGRRVAGVSVSSHGDTACQTGDEKLDAGLDHRLGQSWQRGSAGAYVMAARTPGAPNARRAQAMTIAESDDAGAIAISEFAVDPAIAGLPEGHVRQHFVEFGNYADEAQDVGGWRLIGCGLDGFRFRSTLATVPAGTVLRAGQTFTAALRGTAAAGAADAVFDHEFDFRGAGVWLEDAAGGRVDGVGAYHVNEMDRSVDTPSACSSGLTLPVFAVDRLRGETYQRAQRTGDNSADFVAARHTPGILAPRSITEPGALVAEAVLRLAPKARVAETLSVPLDSEPLPGAAAVHVVAAAAGTSSGPLIERVGANERAADPTALSALTSGDDGYEHPYLRLTAAVSGAPATVQWTGTARGPGEVRLSVWEPEASVWRALDAATPARGADEHPMELRGGIRARDIQNGTVELLVQSVPRSKHTLDANEKLANPVDYDFAITHLTDTQYLSEAYPEVYADVVGWVIANAEYRKIAFATHTGDLIQNWVDPDQPEERARREFAVASDMQAALDDAGVPNSVLPGNHDNKRGVSPALFNEYFGPERYAGTPWYRGSIAPGDNTANYSTFTAGGAPMLMLSLPYAYGEREIAWAEEIVARHPDHNVVVSTHEHVTPKTTETVANRSNSSRWLSHADHLWERVIAPNRNVVLVLSGHFHGLGRIVTEDAGGIPGHTVVEALADYQEFRTHTGERATGFSRLIQVDVAGGRLAVDALSSTLAAPTSAPYDYEQFVPDDGHEGTPSNDRPWRILADGLQNRYGVADDHFTVDLALQYEKGIATTGVFVADR